MVINLEKESVQGTQQQQIEIPEEQKKFLEVLNELLIATQELSFAVALVPQEISDKYSEIRDLTEAAKNVVKATYKLHKLVKRMSR
jgi:predicted RNA-binding protein with EMAP domain